jgi:N-acetylglucosamine malate deacetylase 1
MSGPAKVLIVAAHPDDEVLGCGGTIARHADAGDAVDILFVSDGVGARAGSTADLDRRCKSARAAAEILGARPPYFLNLPDNRLDSVPLLDIIKAIEKFVFELSPTRVYTHHSGDLNIDHRLVHEAVVTACRPISESHVRYLFAFEVLSSTEWGTHAGEAQFWPDHFVDVHNQMDRKLAALAAYAEEMHPFPHPRSIEAVRALATMRGATAGLEAAEGFLTIRVIEK